MAGLLLVTGMCIFILYRRKQKQISGSIEAEDYTDPPPQMMNDSAANVSYVPNGPVKSPATTYSGFSVSELSATSPQLRANVHEVEGNPATRISAYIVSELSAASPNDMVYDIVHEVRGDPVIAPR
jgi:hypothetical protein